MQSSRLSNLRLLPRFLLAVSLISSLTACGGGSDDPAPTTTTTTAAVTTTTAATTTTTTTLMVITGTVATGAALSAATISVTCSTNSGIATSNADGTYTSAIGGGKGPCVLTATKGATILRSVTPGAGVANITPLTDLLTNYLATRAGTTAANLLSTTTGKAILSDSTALGDGQAGVVNLIKTTYNVTLSTTNFLTATIVTPTGGTQNDADKDLDLLKAKGTLLDADGKPTVSVLSTVVTEAGKIPYAPITGGT
jgi:hypothetical protein